MSSAVYLIDELRAALAAPTPEQDRELINLGVPANTICFVGTAKVRPNGKTFEPDPDGLLAWVIPCMDSGETTDLLAFTSDAPGRYWLRLGVATYVGGDALGDTVMDEPVRVFKTPLSWLQSGAPADGLVIVDVDYKLARRDLANSPIIAEDIAHGELLQRELTVVQRPQVRVPRKAAA